MEKNKGGRGWEIKGKRLGAGSELILRCDTLFYSFCFVRFVRGAFFAVVQLKASFQMNSA